METDENIPDYMGATGIREIAFEEIASTSVVTPYGAFPMFLASGTAHHCFLFNSLPSKLRSSVQGNIPLICSHPW